MSLRRRLLASNLVLAGLLAVVFVVLVLIVLSLRSATEAAEHSADVIAAAVAAEKSVLDLETGARGFALTGNAAFLQPWTMARQALPGELVRLRGLVRDNPEQGRLATTISSQATSYRDGYSVRFVRLARQGLLRAVALSRTREGKRRVDALRALFDRMLANERSLAADRRGQADARQTLAIVAVAVGLAICLLFVLVQQAALRRWLLVPLDRLRAVAGRLRGGDLGTRADLEQTDEVGELGAAFDEMAAALQETDEDLRRSNAELEQFAYVASHDLAEPLRVMAGYADLLSRRYRGEMDGRADRYIAGITDGSERMRQLIDDLLAYSRAGRRELDIGPVELGEMVADVQRDLGPAIEDAHAEVVADDLPSVRADAGQLRLILQNLIANAVKFRDPERPPRIEVAAVAEDDAWRVEVRDNGIGIEPRHAERIFRMFQRLHTREEYDGTGIGLALCQRVIERHGGQIWAAPNPDGEGSVIVFTLPEHDERRQAMD
jgi:signal transduction histidine kinase